ncbi:MAG: hypothetical protein AB7N65_18635 [Vicinamibacterales bacterium]
MERLDRDEERLDRDEQDSMADVAKSEDGAIGYIAAWLLGVPASLLFIIFLLRGCN